MQNLAELLLQQRHRSGHQRFGLVGDHEPFKDAYDRAARVGDPGGGARRRSGSRVAVIGTNSRSYLITWMALQLAGTRRR